MKIGTFLMLGAAVLTLSAFLANRDQENNISRAEEVSNPRGIAYLTTVDTGPYTDEDICRTAVSSLLNQEIDRTRTSLMNDGVYKLSYTRSLDNTLWETKCKIEGNRVHWGTFDGRWRNHELDTVIHFSVLGNKLTIQEHYPQEGMFYVEYEKSSGGVISEAN